MINCKPNEIPTEGKNECSKCEFFQIAHRVNKKFVCREPICGPNQFIMKNGECMDCIEGTRVDKSRLVCFDIKGKDKLTKIYRTPFHLDPILD